MHGAVQDHKFGAGLDSIDGAVQERSSAFRLHLPRDVIGLLANLKESRCDAASSHIQLLLFNHLEVFAFIVKQAACHLSSPAYCSFHPGCKRRPHQLLEIKNKRKHFQKQFGFETEETGRKERSTKSGLNKAQLSHRRQQLRDLFLVFQ